MYPQSSINTNLYNGKTDVAIKNFIDQIQSLIKTNPSLDFSSVWAADVNESWEVWAQRQMQAAFSQGAPIGTSISWMFSSLNKALDRVKQVVANAPKPAVNENLQALDKDEAPNKVGSQGQDNSASEVQAYAKRLFDNRLSWVGTNDMGPYLSAISFNVAQRDSYAGYAPYLLEIGHYMGGFKKSPFEDFLLQWAKAAVELGIPEKVTYGALENRVRQIHHSQGLDIKAAKAKGMPEKPLEGTASAVQAAAYSKAKEVLSAMNFTSRIEKAKQVMQADSLAKSYYDQSVAISNRYPSIVSSWADFKGIKPFAVVVEELLNSEAVNSADYGVSAIRSRTLSPLTMVKTAVSQAVYGKSYSFLTAEQTQRLFGTETLSQAPNTPLETNERQAEELFSQNAAKFEAEKKRILNDADIQFHANRLSQVYAHPSTKNLGFYQRWSSWGSLQKMVESYLNEYMSQNLAIGGAIMAISADLTKAYEEANRTIAEYNTQQALAAEKERLMKEQEKQLVIGKGSNDLDSVKIPVPKPIAEPIALPVEVPAQKPEQTLLPDPISPPIKPIITPPIVAPGSPEQIKVTNPGNLTVNKDETTPLPTPTTASLAPANWRSYAKYGAAAGVAYILYSIWRS